MFPEFSSVVHEKGFLDVNMVHEHGDEHIISSKLLLTSFVITKKKWYKKGKNKTVW